MAVFCRVFSLIEVREVGSHGVGLRRNEVVIETFTCEIWKACS